jgi:hypothetical protein
MSEPNRLPSLFCALSSEESEGMQLQMIAMLISMALYGSIRGRTCTQLRTYEVASYAPSSQLVSPPYVKPMR